MLLRVFSFGLRSAFFFGFWLLLLQPESNTPGAVALDWAVGAATAVCAALLSLRIAPPRVMVPRPWPLARLLTRFLIQSLFGGFDVARRALDPRLPIRPSLLRHPTALREGGFRALFGAVTSQVPGTLAISSAEPGELLYHCLDRPQDAAAGLATDEVLFIKALGPAAADSPGRRQ